MDNNLNLLSTNLIALIVEINKKILDHKELFKRFPVPPSHVKVIFYLRHFGSSSVSQISKDLAISKPNMTPIIDRLLSNGFITKYEDPNDRRITIIEPTEKAEECFLAKKQYVRELAEKKLSPLSDTDIDRLNELTEEYLSILSKLN